MPTAIEIISLLKSRRFLLHDEKALQREIHEYLYTKIAPAEFSKEYCLDKGSIVDFLISPGIAIEVKIKGSKREIYRQCARYCQFDQVRELILVTNVSMGFPPEINGKPCFLLKLGTAWL